jgi:polyisoprenoid-binding protein YceI
VLRRSPFFAVIPAGVAVALAVSRWLIQGSGNVYTSLTKRFYVPDQDLGWRIAGDRPIWLGLEAIAITVGVALGLTGAAWLIRRIERRRGRPWRWPRIASWIVSPLPLVIPIAAFATGGPPDHAVEMLPSGQTAAAPTSGFEGGLALPEGTYRTASGSAITARISAGKETFDARFTGVTGAWQGRPGALDGASTATFSVPAASVDTGIDLRSQHAREEYLYANKFPQIGFALDAMIAARQDAPDTLAFRARGHMELMGAQVPVEITGTARALDAAAATRLGLAAGAAGLIVRADTEISIQATPLRADADSFDADRIPIHVDLILANTK